MKKISLMIVCLFAMMAASTGLKAQEVTIPLMPGWTWISYPSTDTLDFATAFGSFTPAVGDVIESQYAVSEYIGVGWYGDIQQFYPGYGYLYYSSRTMPVFLTFNAQPATSEVAVTTSDPTDITTNSATSGGSITTDAYVFAKGICWATHSDPTPMDDNHSESGGGDESFTAEMTELSQNTMYYVRAYVVTQDGITYGNEVSFSTIPIWTIEATPNPTEGGTITGAGDYEQNAICNLTAIANEGYIFANWTENGEVVSTDATYTFTVDAARTLVAYFDLDHTYVDLGLPSGTLWATCNLGANLPEEYGDYFAWGETQPKDNFSWTNYQYCMGSFNTLTKYCNNSDIGYNGFTDDLTTLEPSDDAATANWGDDWRMPTDEEWQELYQNTTVTWTTRNGVNGRLFTASNGNSLFLPAAGYRNESTPEATGIIGDYWTSSLDTDYPSGALSFFFNSNNYYISFCNRLYGRNVRAVRSGSQSTSFVINATANPVEGGVVIGGGSYQMGAECTLNATASEGYTFINWTENGEMVSTDATYTFTVSSDRNLVAAFCEISTYPLLYWFNEDDHTATVTGHCFGQNATGELVIPETVMHYGETYTVTAIGDWAFSGCSGLTGNLFIPNTVTSIGFQSFGFCSGFSGNLIIPNSVSMIVERAFAYCSGFTGELVISNSINRIEQLTFIGCSGFTGNLVIPSSVTSIAWGAFAECIGLTSITPLAEMPPTLTDNPFREFSRDIPIYVPCGSIEAYQNAEGWNEFMNFIEMCPDHAYVDLGLPSGLLWATCNVGADSPEDYGDYFAWGETQPKDTYNWSTYQYCNGDYNTLTKYCNNSSYGYNGFTDDLTTLLPEDDAATANWGSDWRMPTEEEWQELYNNTTVTWTTQNGVNGRLFTASNGNSLFLPAAGSRYDSSLNDAGTYGYYWSSSLDTGNPSSAWYFYFDSGGYYVGSNLRYYGQSVRGVRSGSQNNTPTGAIDGKFTINSNGDQVYFSQGNLQYIGSAATPYWKFADNQWDVLGTTTGQNSSDQNVDRDLFGWGTSGYNHGANCYQPWSTSQSNGGYYAYGSSQYNLYDQTGQADWGYNPISNGGNQANQWRTLTQPEWEYIFNTRITSSGIRYAKANVNNVNGVILLPDDWSSDTYSLSNTNSSGASYSSNTISATQWSTLEQAGAVFLPAAGDRYGTSVDTVGSDGDYWSASYYDSNRAWDVLFFGALLYTDYSNNRYRGFSVRLARVAE